MGASSVVGFPDFWVSGYRRSGWQGPGGPVLSLSTIADCAAWDGGGVFATDYANVTLQGGSRVTGCHARNSGGALALYMGSHVDILEGSVLHDCNATEWGAGMIASLNVHVRIMQSSILECSGGRGGLQLASESTLLATGSVRAPRIELARNAAAHTRSPRYALPHPLSQCRVCPRSATRHAEHRRLHWLWAAIKFSQCSQACSSGTNCCS